MGVAAMFSRMRALDGRPDAFTLSTAGKRRRPGNQTRRWTTRTRRRL